MTISVSEIIFGVLLVAGLLALSLIVGGREILTLRRLGAATDTPDEERHYERRRAVRRLVSSGLTLLLAVLIACLLLFFDSTLGEVFRQRKDVDPKVEATPEQKTLIRIWGGMAISTLVVLLVVLVLAALDLLATRRFARSQYSKIAGDRRAMIQRQVNRLRQERNGESLG